MHDRLESILDHVLSASIVEEFGNESPAFAMGFNKVQ